MSESIFKSGKQVSPAHGEFSASLAEDALFWDLSLGAENGVSLALNSLEFDDSKYPNQLVRYRFDSADVAMDCGEHHLVINGNEKWLEWITLSFTKWDANQQAMLISGKAKAQDGLGFQFKAWFTWQGLFVIQKDRAMACQEVLAFLGLGEDELEMIFTDLPGDRCGATVRIPTGVFKPAKKAATESAIDEPTFQGMTLLQWLEAKGVGKVTTGDCSVAARRIAAKSRGVVPQVIKHLESGRTQYNAAYALGLMGKRARDAVPALIRIMSSGPSSDRFVAAEALCNIGGGEELVAAFLEALNYHDFPVRRCALHGLGRLAPLSRRAMPRIIDALNDAQTIGDAAEALGRFGPDAKYAVPKLLEILADRGWGPDYRRATVEALAKIGTNEAIQAVEQAADDPERAVQKAARRIMQSRR